MTVYELTHLFFRSGGEPVYSPKGLGLFASTESAEEAVRYYKNAARIPRCSGRLLRPAKAGVWGSFRRYGF